MIEVPLDGSPSTTRPIEHGVTAILRAPDAIYAATGATIVRLPLDGGAHEVLLQRPRITALALDGNTLYYAQCACGGHGGIGRIDL